MWLVLGGTARHGTTWKEFIAALLDYMGCNRPEVGCFGVQPAEAEDIRREAAILLEQGHLAGNRTLADATASGSLEAIEQGIVHAIRGALSIARKRVRALGIRQQQIEERFPQHSDTAPSDGRTPTPETDERRLIVFAALLLELKHQRIHPRDAEVIRTRITESITQAAMAERKGVSRQAIHL